jgi:hypothetical protein
MGQNEIGPLLTIGVLLATLHACGSTPMVDSSWPPGQSDDAECHYQSFCCRTIAIARA